MIGWFWADSGLSAFISESTQSCLSANDPKTAIRERNPLPHSRPMLDQIAEKRSISLIRPDTTNSSLGKIIVSGTA